MNYPNPLNEQDHANLQELCKSCHGTAQLIEDCKACGLPMDEQEAANKAQQEAAERMRRKFFPMVP